MRRPGRETWRPASRLGGPPPLLERREEPPARPRRLPDLGGRDWERAAILGRAVGGQLEGGRGKGTVHPRVAGVNRLPAPPGPPGAARKARAPQSPVEGPLQAPAL